MRRSPIEALLTYASFFALSVLLHMVVILGGRESGGVEERAGGEAGRTAATAPDPRRAEEDSLP